MSAARVENICRSWLGTPYGRGQCFRGRAVDCANFVVAVLDELYGRHLLPVSPVPSRPGDAADRTEIAIATIMRRFPHERMATSASIEAGDVIFVRTGYRIGHILIAGARPGVLWHSSSGVGVSKTSIGAFAGKIERVYRMKDRHLWNAP